jgi:cell wall-associated NlpC family hydrolase
MAAQQEAIRGFEAEIRQLQAEERDRQRRIAEEARRRLEAERAAAAAAASAAAAQTPQIGGSAGGDAPVALPAPPPSDGSLGARAVSAAMQWLGTPYSWGGGSASGPTAGIGRGAGTVGFDCSGLTLYAWAQAGVSLSHFTGSQWNEGARISSMSQLLPGDLVFFGGDLGHMGMYIGGGQMIHAPHTGDVVKISAISSGYYASAFRGGVRPA